MSDLKTTFEVEVDDDTMPLLMDLAAATGCPPRKLLASIVRDVIHDDARHHSPPDRQRLN